MLVDLPGVDMTFAVFLSVLCIFLPQNLPAVPIMEGMIAGQHICMYTNTQTCK
jgi:hypothetical protein